MTLKTAVRAVLFLNLFLIFPVKKGGNNCIRMIVYPYWSFRRESAYEMYELRKRKSA